MNKTAISWTDFSSNPIKYLDADGNIVWACVKTSPGCSNCYSEALAKRWNRGGPFTRQTMEGLTPFIDEKELKELLVSKAISGKRVFVADMTDWCGEWVTYEMWVRVLDTLGQRPDVTFQTLTKRAGRQLEFMKAYVCAAPGNLPKNVHIGVSAEDQQRADERIPLLLQTPAAVRWVSFEPLLSAIEVRDGLCFHSSDDPNQYDHSECAPTLGWAVIGGESGAGYRECDPAWIVSLADQCKSAGVPVYVKQGSGPRPGMQGRIPLETWKLKEVAK